MKLFSEMLNKGINNAGIECEIWRPSVFFGHFSKSANKGLGKWLGYLDKWILYPVVLKMCLLKTKYNHAEIRFHICDHSNSPYLAYLPSARTAITCHDVLAIRGALGFRDAYCNASGLGIILQKWILKNLLKAEKLAAVSHLTLKQLKALSNSTDSKPTDWQVIHNAFNQEFNPIPKTIAEQKVQTLGLPANTPFILHLGSSLKRKNRKLLLDMVVELGDGWNGIVCFAGDGIDADLGEHINKLGLQNRVKSVIKPSHENILALYSACEAFVFPSFSEGFGWPVIEAQACGAVVIASNIEPMPEVSGGAALHENPDKPADFARAFLFLQNGSVKHDLVSKGFENCKRFSSKKMADAYLSLHNLERK
ncbi:MAG: group 1 glycosyl transferase [Ferruginibacter sp.]|nr:group 1 glycosyl transferase [Ferruginibacter sp.]